MFRDKNQPKISVMEKSLGANSANQKWLWIALSVLTLIALAAIILFVYTRKQLHDVKQSLQANPSMQAKEANRELIAKVGKLIILPGNEEPTIATVTDLSKLARQPFFAKAQIGDKVLIYSGEKKAILYRPSTNQIIELAPLLNGTNTPGTPAP
jgi:uncharacterized protein YneF (UPF0154 family)